MKINVVPKLVKDRSECPAVINDLYNKFEQDVADLINNTANLWSDSHQQLNPIQVYMCMQGVLFGQSMGILKTTGDGFKAVFGGQNNMQATQLQVLDAMENSIKMARASITKQGGAA